MPCRTGPKTEPDRANPDRTVPLQFGPQFGVLDQFGLIPVRSWLVRSGFGPMLTPTLEKKMSSIDPPEREKSFLHGKEQGRGRSRFRGRSGFQGRGRGRGREDVIKEDENQWPPYRIGCGRGFQYQRGVEEKANLIEGDLHQCLKEKGALSPPTAVNFSLDIPRGKTYLHNEPNVIVHRDLKPRKQTIYLLKMMSCTLLHMLEGEPPLSHSEAAKSMVEGHMPHFRAKGYTPELK
nr:serine/threonine-protein kinase STY46-like [Tanacetum cinerariifolium]